MGQTEWYERLSEYFPPKELKSEEQIDALLATEPAYHKIVTDNYLLIYADFPRFIFLDYLLVFENARGRGMGGQILSSLKRYKKPLIGELEPRDLDDPDTIRRIRFYERHGFEEAPHIEYRRRRKDGTAFRMLVYYWTPDGTPEDEIYDDMTIVCDRIHNFRSTKYYGRQVADADQVLRWH